MLLFREKSFVKLTCKFRPKKIGLYSENVILTIKRRNNFKTTITLTGRCLMGNINTILHDSIENEVGGDLFIYPFYSLSLVCFSLGIIIIIYVYHCNLTHKSCTIFFSLDLRKKTPSNMFFLIKICHLLWKKMIIDR